MVDSVTWTITELTDWMDAVVAQGLGGEIWVEGEITNLNRSPNGHVYFTLVERVVDASTVPSLNVVLFDWHRTNVNHHLRRAGGAVRMADGVRVRIRGDVKLYAARSQYQLRMTTIDPAFTLGSLAAERAALLARLDREGLLGANGALVAPAVPLRVAIVTSLGSAAHADAIHELSAAGIGFEIAVVDSRVQGPDAPADLVRALSVAAGWGPDVIALVRGGGARTDLAAFDDESVARAIAASPVPVWCGLGHETDRSVADEVAHRSWKTPTACADAIVELVVRARDRTETTWSATATAVGRHLDRSRHLLAQRTSLVAMRSGMGAERAEQRVAASLSTLTGRSHARLLDGARAVDSGRHALGDAVDRRLGDAARTLDDRSQLIRAHDPARALARGWSITRTDQGHLVRSPLDAPAASRLVTHTAGGDVRSTVDGP